MKQILRIFGAVVSIIALMLCMTACTKNEKEEVTQETQVQEQESVTPVQKKEPDPDLMTSITVEAGKDALVTEDFFTVYSGQEFKIIDPLSEEQLRTVGGDYDVTVLSDGKGYVIAVKIVDTTPPTIKGVKKRTVYQDSSVSYKKNIKVTDNSNENVKLVVDKSKVDVNKLGTYPVSYSATDSSGNKSTAETTITVIEKIEINEAYVRPMVKKIVSKVIKSSMTEKEKAYALYKWCRNNISYGSKGDRSSIWTGAYEGIHDRRGDCFTYYATYAAMLEIAGIDNMKVTRVGGKTNHWWNLVNIDGQWYHCDASPRRRGDSYICFMQTDAQVAAYTKSNKVKPNYYTFDTSLYPERATKVVYENK